MSGDWSTEPQARAWLAHVRHQVLPMLHQSALTMVVAPEGEPDLKIAVELGMSILLNKPIIVVVRPGQVPPPGLARVAHEVVVSDPTQPGGSAALVDVLRRFGVGE